MSEKIFRYGAMGEDIIIEHMVRLPKGADILVVSGQEIAPLDAIAAVLTHGKHEIIDVAKVLGVKTKKTKSCLFISVGDDIDAGEILAQHKKILGKLRVITAPFNGSIIDIEEGVLFLEAEKTFKDIISPIPGRVIEIEPDDHITIRTVGVRIDLAWGSGSSAWATLKPVSSIYSNETLPEEISFDTRGEIILMPSTLTESLLTKAAEVGVKGVIAGSAPSNMISIMEESVFPIGLINGFGIDPMAEEVFRLLSRHRGEETALDTSQRDDWRGSRPQIIIPLRMQSGFEQEINIRPSRYEIGSTVRVSQPPYLGLIGRIVSLPSQSKQLESGHWRKGATVMIGKDEIFVPFENLEHIK